MRAATDAQGLEDLHLRWTGWLLQVFTTGYSFRLWVAFCRAGLDAIILEVGLGGRLDAVNVFEADCAIVTSVAMDHMEFLGGTREAIGFEKAGIFRSGRPAICADPIPPASLIAHAQSIGAKLWVSGRDFGFAGDQNHWAFWIAGGSRRGGLAYPALRGTNQLLERGGGDGYV